MVATGAPVANIIVVQRIVLKLLPRLLLSSVTRKRDWNRTSQNHRLLPATLSNTNRQDTSSHRQIISLHHWVHITSIKRFVWKHMYGGRKSSYCAAVLGSISIRGVVVDESPVRWMEIMVAEDEESVWTYLHDDGVKKWQINKLLIGISIPHPMIDNPIQWQWQWQSNADNNNKCDNRGTLTKPRQVRRGGRVSTVAAARDKQWISRRC